MQPSSIIKHVESSN